MSFQSPDKRGIGGRRLAWAMFVSTLLHVLVLWQGPVTGLRLETQDPLHATLRSRPAEPGETRRQATAPSAQPLPRTAATPIPVTPVLDQPAPAAVPVLAASGTSSNVAAVAAVTASMAGMAGNSAPAGKPAAEAMPAQSADFLEGMRGYRLAVASQARRFKRYPADALAAGWSGNAEVRFEVGSDGQARPATVSRSSGYDSLDRAALAMVDAGAARARLPDSLRGRSFAVQLPVEFNVEER